MTTVVSRYRRWLRAGVIAGIAVIGIAFLLPALQRAREMARRPGFMYSQVDITEPGDNERVGPEDWISTTPLNSDIDDPESLGLPPTRAESAEIYRIASNRSALRERYALPNEGVYCPICHIANIDVRKLRTPCPKCGRELLKFGWQ